MFEKLELFQLAGGLTRHAGERQAELARNIANADTPGYRARDVADFATTWQNQGTVPLRTTRPLHISKGENQGAFRVLDAPDQTSPNGNTVSLESQMLKSSEVQSRQDMAVAIYRSSMSILRTALGRRA